jgi:ribonuclease J
MEVLKILIEDNQSNSGKNRIVVANLNKYYKIKGSGDITGVEFLNMTHSTIQSAAIAVHTREGVVIYANDFKLDNTPTFGEPPNYKRLKELSQKGVRALIVDCLYAPDDRKTPSEKIARGLLEDVFFTTENRNSGMVVTTFSSHIARLKTISEFGRKLNREVVFLGRSLGKYMTAAKNVGKAPFSRDIRIYTYRKQVEKALKRINQDRKRYLVVCTGHQGEPGSILDRLARGQLPLKLEKEDQIIFSSKTIPSPVNEENRAELEKRLRRYHVRIFDNVHVSGHGGREDLRDLLKLIKPEHVIPSHGDLTKTSAGARLAEEVGYKINKTVHLMNNGKVLEIHKR